MPTLHVDVPEHIMLKFKDSHVSFDDLRAIIDEESSWENIVEFQEPTSVKEVLDYLESIKK